MKKLIVIILSALVSFQVSADGDPAKGKELTTTCLACHGETGNSMAGAFPNLGGQSENYLLKQLTDIQSGARPVPTMMGLLDNMTEADLANLAAYYAGQSRSFGAAKEELVELGESIYLGGIPRKNIASCASCHSPSGNGNNPAAWPALAGQWPEYTVTQLKAFQSGERMNDGDSRMMRTIARDMNEQEMEAVASYLYGLR